MPTSTCRSIRNADSRLYAARILLRSYTSLRGLRPTGGPRREDGHGERVERCVAVTFSTLALLRGELGRT